MLKEPTRRIRFLTRDEAQRLLLALPAHFSDMAAFALATGLRRATVTSLQWLQVNLVRRVDSSRPGEGAKSDLRHTWASWHVQDGTPLFALQELGGWESPEMVRRYAHLSAGHLARYADRLCTWRAAEGPADGTFTAQSVNDKGPA
jgi:integrase